MGEERFRLVVFPISFQTQKIKNTTMENNKKRFYVYASWEEQFELLTTEEKATMLMNLFKYAKGEEPTLDTTGLKLVWAGMKFLLEKDNTEYQKSVQRAQNAAAAKKISVQVPTSPEPVKEELEPVKNNLNRVDNDNVNVNVNDNVNDNGDGNGDEKGKEWFLERLNNGTPYKELYSLYPQSSSLKEALTEWI